jgi:hypothetical protein
MAKPRCPNLPDLPILCRYVSAVFGKSKLMTTFTLWMSMPLVKRSEHTRCLVAPVLNSWNTLLRSVWRILAWM